MNQDYKQLLTDVIKKQIVILGPDITLSKARNVKGLTVANDGTVTAVVGQPQEVIQALIDQFVQLSGLIVKKTMEPLLAISQTPTTTAPATPASSNQTTPTPVVATSEALSQPVAAAPVVNSQGVTSPVATQPVPSPSVIASEAKQSNTNNEIASSAAKGEPPRNDGETPPDPQKIISDALSTPAPTTLTATPVPTTNPTPTQVAPETSMPPIANPTPPPTQTVTQPVPSSPDKIGVESGPAPTGDSTQLGPAKNPLAA